MYCPRCGTETDDEARFCGACGTEIESGFTLSELESRPIIIEVLSGPSTGRRKELTQSEIRIGRDLACDLALLNEPHVSARHCRLIAHAGALWIEDLRSTNGTFVNGRRIDRQKLRVGDEIRLGPAGTLLKATLAKPVAGPAPTSAPPTQEGAAANRRVSVEADAAAGGEETGLWRRLSAALAAARDGCKALARATWTLLIDLPDIVPAPPLLRAPVRLVLRILPLLLLVVVLWVLSTMGPVGERLENYRSKFQTEREMARIVEFLAARLRADASLPDELWLFLAQSFSSPGDKPPWRDHFGGEYWLEEMWGDGENSDVLIGFHLGSPGVDGERHTGDDIVRSYRPPNWKEIAKEPTGP